MYPQSMFLSRSKKNNVYPCKRQFYYIKIGFKGSKLYRHIFVMGHIGVRTLKLLIHFAQNRYILSSVE